MSRRYKGALLSGTPPTISSSAASGQWTLQQQMQAIETAWPFGGPFNYIEDVFSTWLYTGNGTSQTITNGIDLSTKGGLVWCKDRTNASDHYLFDTVRGVDKALQTDTTAAQLSVAGNGVNPFNSNGFTVNGNIRINVTSDNYASWTFRKQKKFFDIVTYTGNGSDQNIAHNLSSVPGFVAIKRTDSTGNWSCYHKDIGNNYILLNTTAAAVGTGNPARTVTSTTFQIYGNFPDEGSNGGTYVMYLFAHNAGGFGTSNADNVISCGSYTGNGTVGNAVTLGYEPQWIMVKRTDTTSDWVIYDIMRGCIVGTGGDNTLYANLTATESAGNTVIGPTATGFVLEGGAGINATGGTFIYIAIRRGPMAVPTLGTSVLSNIIGNDTAAQTTNFPVDMVWDALPSGSALNIAVQNRLFIQYNSTFSNSAASAGNNVGWQSNTQITPGNFGNPNTILNSFRRAPGFFDVTTYVGNPSSAFYVYHNLGVTPDLVITKCTTSTGEWWVQYPSVDTIRDVQINSNSGQGVFGYPFSFPSATSATRLFFNTFGSNIDPCKTGQTYIVYLFATLAGVSKVGSYTGSGALQTINCGFTSGARFILIKRLDATGDWYLFNSASGISSGNDPYMSTNLSTAQVTGTNYVDTATTGFQVTAAASATVNVSAGTYLFLAIA